MSTNKTTTSSVCRSGQYVGDYQMLALLAKGEHGEVWSALSSQGDICALKIFLSENMEDARQEYDRAMRFTHPNILSPIAFLPDERPCVIVLPYCEGRSVDAVVGHMSEGLLWQLVRDVSGALCKIHSQGWVHLNVNPSNILWNGTSFLLTDFGECVDEEVVKSGVLPAGGSYRYDAPERFSKVTGACDIWSLGATVFHLYMGCYVFNGLGGRVQQPHSPLPYMRKSMPALSELVTSCLAFNASERPVASVIYEQACGELKRRESLETGRLTKKSGSMQEKEDSCGFWPDSMIE